MFEVLNATMVQQSRSIVPATETVKKRVGSDRVRMSWERMKEYCDSQSGVFAHRFKFEDLW